MARKFTNAAKGMNYLVVIHDVPYVAFVGFRSATDYVVNTNRDLRATKVFDVSRQQVVFDGANDEDVRIAKAWAGK
jgi:hypothetical protein